VGYARLKGHPTPPNEPTLSREWRRRQPALARSWNWSPPGRVSRVGLRRFELLKRTYYSSSYAINREDLDAVAAAVRTLRDLVERLCRERLAKLRSAAGF
jgi:hypothetical protein